MFVTIRSPILNSERKREPREISIPIWVDFKYSSLNKVCNCFHYNTFIFVFFLKLKTMYFPQKLLPRAMKITCLFFQTCISKRFLKCEL